MTSFVSVLITLTFLIFSVIEISGDKPCAPRREETYESVICVCNSTYCDEISKIEKQPGNFILYTSSKSGLRFEKQEGTLEKYERTLYENTDIVAQVIRSLNLRPKTDDIIFHVHRDNSRQIIKGFGGAFTDSAAIVFEKFSEKSKENLIKSYYSENGIEYTLGRVPVGGTDFSVRSYTYCENDTTIASFALVEEDYKYKIPFINAANKAANNKLKLIAAAWSPPLWMKTSHQFIVPGEIIPEYYQTWAEYHVKFMKEYEKLGVKFWAFSTGNEPITGVTGVRDLLSVGWYPNTQARWIAENLGPTLRKKENYPNMKIITMDENRHAIFYWIPRMSLNQKAMSYIDGVSVHWYDNWNLHPPLGVAAEVHHMLYKDIFLIATEASKGSLLDVNVDFGSWERAEAYIKDILDDLNHWFVGWIDWNLILNSEGGPSWLSNFVDSSVIFFEEKDEFIKQPMFYAMGHVSKFVPRGSVNINVDQVAGPNVVDKAAFLRPDGGISVVFYNGYNTSHKVTVKEKGLGQASFTVPPHSINSLVFW